MPTTLASVFRRRWALPTGLLGFASFCITLFACSAGDTIDQHPCPSGGTPLTYENFGQAFMNQWCEPCHAGSAPARNGAPPAYTFDTEPEVAHWKDRIFARAADDNTSMPPGPDGPPSDERHKLGDWLACGAP